ncbi:uncharacterized protein LOC120707855 isoform X2 [Panicum virgatum]|uniref:uncharacterized protein LOC120707855 isoform X2 n=1 Tax=Panicum virgatum TaxID=38727 RepID=UPI0019D54AA2|nr:uncharacterized protein LOC120707855 isoform X2 [Panicum virgatum]
MVEKILQLAAHITCKNHIPRAPNCSVPPISLSILQSPRPQIHSIAIAAHRVHRSRSIVHRRRRIKLLPIPPLTVFLAVNLEAQFLDDAAAVAYVPLAAGGWGHVQRQWDGKRCHRVLHCQGSLYLLLCMIPSIRPSLSQRPSRICAPCSLSPILLHSIQKLMQR